MTRLELSIAWRYLRSRRGSRLLSLISVIAIGGVLVGVSALIGFAFLFSTTPFPFGPVGLPFWVVARFFLIPFCVSSFSALAQGKGFLLVLFPRWQETALAAGLCALFVLVALVVKRACTASTNQRGGSVSPK